MKTVVGLFDSTSDAQRMLEELMQMGFQGDDISVVTNVASRPKVEAGTIHLDAMDLADVGAIAAGGPLRDTLKRSTGPSIALRGALERSGFPSDVADRYAAGVERGGTLESLVVPDSEADRVVTAMKRRSERRERTERTEESKDRAMMGGDGPAGTAQRKVPATEPTTGTRGVQGVQGEEELRIPIVREVLKVGKRAIERGGVRIAVHTVEKPVTEQVHLRESHVEIERRAVDRPVAADGSGFKDQTIELSEEGEETIVSKQARIVEELVVHKHVTDRVETIRESVRATQVDFGKIGGFDAAGYRQHFAGTGAAENFEEYEPAYRFGDELSGTGSWEEIEASTKSRWEAEHPGTWERFKDAIRFGHRRKVGND
jgi:uncharacterized protein (TIGR02271 family)